MAVMHTNTAKKNKTHRFIAPTLRYLYKIRIIPRITKTAERKSPCAKAGGGARTEGNADFGGADADIPIYFPNFV